MNKHSILRTEEYKILSKLNLDGKIIDLGGSKTSTYHKLLNGNHTIETVNINNELFCDMVFDLEKRFPIEDNSYDNALCVNVLEHIFDFDNVISETSRILKSGGKIILFTPFIFHIHGSPNDYFRYTKTALKRILEKNNFKDIEIYELGFGLFSMIFQTIEAGISINILRILFRKMSIFLDKFLLRISKKYNKLCNNIPLGYFISAVK